MPRVGSAATVEVTPPTRGQRTGTARDGHSGRNKMTPAQMYCLAIGATLRVADDATDPAGVVGGSTMLAGAVPCRILQKIHSVIVFSDT